eukprot:Awhi_evm1s1954
MARTKQTARKSTSGTAPRRQYFKDNDDKPKVTQKTLVDIYNSTETRTIAVEGSDEFTVDPDLVNLSFDINEESQDYQEAIMMTLRSLDEAKKEVLALDISNEQVSCDSLCVSDRVVILKNGVEVDEEFDDDGEVVEDPAKIKPRIILRVCLEGEDVKLFGKLMLKFVHLGIPNYQAPLYETSMLTEHRNKARENAIKNAQEKARIILSSIEINRALNDTTVMTTTDQEQPTTLSIGMPIAINDIHCDIEDDSCSSFSGNSSAWYMNAPIGSKSKKKIKQSTNTTESNANVVDGDAAFIESLMKRSDDLFTMPSLRIIAQIKEDEDEDDEDKDMNDIGMAITN